MRSDVRHHHATNQWHSFFAWFPIKIAVSKTAYRWVWLESVERTYIVGWGDGYYVYRDPRSELTPHQAIWWTPAADR